MSASSFSGLYFIFSVVWGWTDPCKRGFLWVCQCGPVSQPPTPPYPSHQAPVPVAPWTARCLRTGMCGNQNRVRSVCVTVVQWCVTMSTVMSRPTAQTPSSPMESAVPSALTMVTPTHQPFTFYKHKTYIFYKHVFIFQATRLLRLR